MQVEGKVEMFNAIRNSLTGRDNRHAACRTALSCYDSEATKSYTRVDMIAKIVSMLRQGRLLTSCPRSLARYRRTKASEMSLIERVKHLAMRSGTSDGSSIGHGPSSRCSRGLATC